MKIEIILFFCAIMTVWVASASGSDDLPRAPDTNRPVVFVRCPGAGPEYKEAYRSFLDAWATDQGGRSYTSSITVLRKASQNAPNTAVKLRCLLLLAWAQYLDNAAEEARMSVMESLKLATQAAGPGDKSISLLNKLKALIASGSVVRPSDLKKYVNVDAEISALMEDLFYLEKSRGVWRQMSLRRAEKAKALLEAGIADEGKALGISDADLEKIRPVLWKKHEKRQLIDFSGLADDLENEYARMLLNELVK